MTMRIAPILLVALLVSLPTLLQGLGSPSPVVQDAEDDARADELVDRWIEAVGGREAFSELRTARYALTTELYESDTGRLRRARPRYVTLAKTPQGNLTRIERWEGNDFIVQTWDGETVRATMNGEPLAPGDKDWDETAYVSGDVHYWMGLPYKLRDPGVNLHYVGEDQGMELVGVSFGEGVGLHDGDQWRYWFEEGHTWPARLAYREEDSENWNVLSFQDMQEEGDYVYVGARVHYDDEGEGGVWKILRTGDLEWNPELPEGTFDQPGTSMP